VYQNSTAMKYRETTQSTSLPPQPKDCFKRGELVRTRCFHGVNHHGVHTTCFALNKFEWGRVTRVSKVRTVWSSESVQRKATYCTLLMRRLVEEWVPLALWHKYSPWQLWQCRCHAGEGSVLMFGIPYLLLFRVHFRLWARIEAYFPVSMV